MITVLVLMFLNWGPGASPSCPSLTCQPGGWATGVQPDGSFIGAWRFQLTSSTCTAGVLGHPSDLSTWRATGSKLSCAQLDGEILRLPTGALDPLETQDRDEALQVLGSCRWTLSIPASAPGQVMSPHGGRVLGTLSSCSASLASFL